MSITNRPGTHLAPPDGPDEPNDSEQFGRFLAMASHSVLQLQITAEQLAAEAPAASDALLALADVYAGSVLDIIRDWPDDRR